MNLFDRILNKIWRTFPIPKARIEIGNKMYHVPRMLLNNFYKSNYKQESWLIQLISRITGYRTVETFIDVGVNVGQTLLKVKSINSHIQYVGFEPNPFCLTITQNIIKKNKITNCTLVPVALSDHSGIQELLTKEEHGLADSAGSIVKNFRNYDGQYNRQTVPLFVFDEIFTHLPLEKMDVLKIDVEGAELEVIIGMQHSIAIHQPWIIIEVLPSYNLENEFRIKRQTELNEILQRLKYSIWQIHDKPKELSFIKCPNFPIHSDLELCDYLLLPNTTEALNFVK